MDHPEFVEQAEPEEIFGLLSDDTRIEILRTLWNSDDGMTFSDLHDAVDVRDSGQFNYHLDKLVGQFVEKNGNRYELTAAGNKINGAIEAGSYTTRGAMEPVTLDPPCQTCGGERTFHYEDESVRVECDSCDVQARFSVPPSTFIDSNREEIPAVAGEYLNALIERLDRGFCSQCDGPVDVTVCRLPDSSHWEETQEVSDQMGDVEDIPIVQYECHQCGNKPTSGLSFTLLNHPEVVGFYYDHGIDIRDRSIWEILGFNTDNESVRSDDPFRAQSTFTVDDEQLTIVVDADKTVLETKRTTLTEV